MDNTINIKEPDYLLNNKANGHVKVWEFEPGKENTTRLLAEESNLIVKTGASILASSLAGQNNSAISHFYVGYTSDPGFVYGNLAAVGVSDTVTSFTTGQYYGYLRIPLAFPPAFMQETGYVNNVPYFTTFLTNGTSFTQQGLTFGNGVQLYSLGLVNAQNPSGSNQDRLFSKVFFGPITYDSSHGLAITWGIAFRAVDIS